MQGQETIVATAIALLLLYEEAMEGIRNKILTIWALCEGILDVKALLEGNKIPLIKGDGQWMIQFKNLLTVWNMKNCTKEQQYGMEYTHPPEY